MQDDSGSLLRNRNFLWHLSGAVINMLGDQFTILAMPWLVVKMTYDPLAVGAVLALSSVPRFIFLLLGGALVDRYSPKRVLMLGRYANTLLLGTFGGLVLTGSVNIWIVYVFALLTGLSSAFYIPAARSLLPHIVPAAQVQPATSIVNSCRQVSMMAVPPLAGVLISLFGDGENGVATHATGLAVAFLFDAFTFAASILTLARVRITPAEAGSAPGHQARTLALVGEGLRYAWQNMELRIVIIYVAVISLCVSGPIVVSIPMLASQIGQSALSLGILNGAFGAGSLAGTGLAGSRPSWARGSLATMMLLGDCVNGLLFLVMAHVDQIYQAAVLLFIVGLSVGFIQIYVAGWLQITTPKMMIGRMLSLFMLITFGVSPLSGILAGWAMRQVDISMLFTGSGILLLVIVLVAWTISPMRNVFAVREGRAGDL
ncbi:MULTISPECIES: MFS transporter [unclassified Bradyrhizobium]|uniref:MFS transporter n=1 Tax=unclassified Bradyrhizobium TaxID=2631580 RepID=UPI0029160D67|nr:MULTISPECIES: MFS transporter [unclassified Bradyrhizobium]